MPVALITHVIHFAWPDASARGCTVSPSSTTGRNGRPFTAGGGTGWTFAAISTVIDFISIFFCRRVSDRDLEQWQATDLIESGPNWPVTRLVLLRLVLGHRGDRSDDVCAVGKKLVELDR